MIQSIIILNKKIKPNQSKFSLNPISNQLNLFQIPKSDTISYFKLNIIEKYINIEIIKKIVVVMMI
jgi:hypothetical protein